MKESRRLIYLKPTQQTHLQRVLETGRCPRAWISVLKQHLHAFAREHSAGETSGLTSRWSEKSLWLWAHITRCREMPTTLACMHVWKLGVEVYLGCIACLAFKRER
jgi:hypothetical protein